MKNFFLLAIALCAIYLHTNAQGCVAIRSMGGYCTAPHADSSKWQVSINNRYFKSYKHFVAQFEPQGVVEIAFETDIDQILKIGTKLS